VNPEATSLVVVVVLGSLALAFGIWFRPDWRWILLITASGMAVFTLFDIREAAHQFSESNASLGLTAIVVALLHASAAIGAVVLWRADA
jgi:hypothetical protein